MESLTIERNLKANATQRILKDMIQDTKNNVEAGFLIIVVDDYTVKILSSFLTMTEVLNEGIFSIERLQTKRQPYPKYDALYFISPTNESCELLAKDFQNEKNPMYRRIHIFFSHEIIDMIFEKIITPGVVKRAKTCKELNLSFLIRDKNLFELGLPGALKLFTVKNNKDNRDKLLSCIKERLATVCGVLRESPHIQYQGNSPIAMRLAEYMNGHLTEYFNMRTSNEKRGIMLIVDRTVDISTPMLHDYNYETMIYDLFNTKENELEFNDKKYKLDDKDELWVKYKNKHMCQVFEELQKDFDSFMQNDYSKVNKTEEQSFDEMANVLSNMKGYKLKTSQFSLHLKLAEEITNRYKQNNLYELIELEQDIVTGVSQNGDSISLKDINNKFSLLRNKFQKKDTVRLISSLHSSLDITEKDFTSYADTLNIDEKKPIYNLEWLGISFAKSKSKNARREPTLNKSEIKKFKNKSKQLEYTFLRSSPKLEGIVDSCSKLELNRSEFPFIQEPKNLTVPKKKNYYVNNDILGSNSEEDEQPYLILFVIGGVSHNEICALENLYQQKALNHHLIIGSTSIITANQYVEQLRDLSSPVDITASVVDGKTEKCVDITDIELGLIKK